MDSKTARAKTGIDGLDSMMEGGFPRKSIISAMGPAGIGKSILALQFIFSGAKKGEKGLYITLEEPRENIDRTIDNFSFAAEFRDLEKQEKISILCLNYSEFEKVYPEVFRKIEKDKTIKRIVIDSFNCFFSYLKLDKITIEEQGYETRKILSQSFNLFRKNDFTTLLILENGSANVSDLNRYVEYMADGILHLDFLSLGSIERRIFIPKMRWTNQYDSSVMFKITKKGIVLMDKN